MFPRSSMFVILAILLMVHECVPNHTDPGPHLPKIRRDLDSLDPIPIKNFEYKDKATRIFEGTSGDLGVEPMNNYKFGNSRDTYQPQGTHEITGKAYADNPSGVGVGLGYRHIPSGSELSSDFKHNGNSGEGTISGKLSLHNSENSRLDAFADYTRRFNSRGSDDSRGRIGVEFKKTWRK